MVNFVGAGPGAEDLITVRGLRLIQQADVIIYAGSLVNKELLTSAKDNCDIYNSAHMTLGEVINVIEEAENDGKMTVRLHTGDPSIYGAIREQMDCLNEKNIEYAICPGVSSFCGAAASLRMEYTLPGVSQTVILTRMEGRTEVPSREDIVSLAAHNATMIVFLSAKMIDELVKRLIKGGYKSTTKASIVYKATWPEEKTIRGTLETLSEQAARENITKTALIIIGDVLGDEYEYSKLYDETYTTGYRAAKNRPAAE